MIRVDKADLEGLVPAQAASLVRRRLRSVKSGDDWFNREQLPVPEAFREALPTVGLARGAAVDYTGVVTPVLGIVAAASQHGGCSLVNYPGRGRHAGLLAAHEMGAQLHRIAVVTAPDNELVRTIRMLLDGMDLVVVDLGAVRLPPQTVRTLTGLAHSHRCTLFLCSSRRIAEVDVRLTTQVVDSSGLGCGRGYLKSQTFEIASEVGDQTYRAEVVTMGRPGGGMTWAPVADDPQVVRLPTGTAL